MTPSRKGVRPGPVSVIAAFYFFAAGFVLLITALSALEPELGFSSRQFVQVITYVVTRHNIPTEALIPVVMPVLGVYFAAIGFGLWRLKTWARNLVVATSGTAVVLWLRALLIRQWAMGDQLFHDRLARDTVYTVILINAAIVLCLTMYPDVSRAFGDQDE